MNTDVAAGVYWNIDATIHNHQDERLTRPRAFTAVHMNGTTMCRRLAARRLLSPSARFRRGLATTTTSPTEIFDIVCIGGGPAGLSLLAALRRSPATRSLKIALVDSQKLSASTSTDADVYSNRCSSLTPASVAFLRRTDVWDHIDTQRTQDYQRMHVWDGVSGTKISFDPEDRRSGILSSITSVVPGTRWASQQSDDTIATMCENTNLTTALLRQLQTMSNLEIFDSTKVSAIALGPEPADEESPDLSQWPVVSLSGRSLAARLLIGADGANSPVRQFADIPAHGWDYNAQGVVATLTVDRSFEYIGLHTAYQRFLPTGPIALLPLPDNKVSLVWSTTPQLAAKLKSLSSDDFIAMVNGAFRLLSTDLAYIHTLPSAHAEEVAWREGQTDSAALGLPATIPRVTAVQQGSIASFPLKMRHADLYTGHRVALIGDAAHTIHPLAGQGLNLGLADAEALAARIVEGVETGMDIGSSWCLDNYNSDRWAANNAVMGVCDKLNKLYSTDSAPVVAARSLGLGLVDRLGPLKGMIMGAAAGAR